MPQIEDGTGTGLLARVDAQNRLDVHSVSRTEQLEAGLEGRSYNYNTGIINLTSDSESAVMYFKNNESNRFILINVIVGINFSTGGSATDMAQVKIVRNPTGGTIVSSPTDVDIKSNRNFGSNDSLTVDVYKGAEGNTLTGGADHVLALANDGGRLVIPVDEVLPKGSSIGINVTPPTSNTSMDVYAVLVGHKEGDD